MPTLVIHRMGQAPQKASFDLRRIRVGRDPASDVVLPAQTVSREHAVFESSPDGRWFVSCVSETNPVVVDSVLTTQKAPVTEGSEVLIGTEYLLIFVGTEFAAQAFLKQQSYFSRSECAGCGWSGMISTLRRTPVCPRCAGKDLRSENAYDGEQARQQATNSATAAMSMEDVQASLRTLKAAKKSRLERIDGGAGGPPTELSESGAVILGKAAVESLRLRGFVFGTGVRIQWNGRRFVAESLLTWPSMKVNGSKAASTQLAHGDVIEVGRNRFRFVTS